MRTSVFILMLVGVGWTQFLPAQDPCPCREVWGSLWTPESGIFFEAGYYGEVFTNARGGISSKGATQYFGLLDLFLTCDFERLRSPVPGKFVMLAQNTHGRGIAADFTGATQLLSDIDSSSNIAQVSEYWWEVEMLDGALTLRLGKQDLNDHFVYIDAAANYLQSSFELTPSAVVPSYPHSTIGAVSLLQLNDSLRLKLGVWDPLGSGGGWGWSGMNTVLAISELEYRYSLGEGTLPGVLSVAASYLSAGTVSGEPFGANHSYALQWEQCLYRECSSDPDDQQGLTIFGAFYPRFAAEPKLEGSIGHNFAAGATYVGLVPCRDRDMLGAGVVWAQLFQGGENRELVIECFYKAEWTPRFRIQPDVQYVISPSGIHRDALAIGTRFEVLW